MGGYGCWQCLHPLDSLPWDGVIYKVDRTIPRYGDEVWDIQDYPGGIYPNALYICG